MPRIEIAEQAGTDLRGDPRPTEDRVVVVDSGGEPQTGAIAVLDGATEQRPGLPSGGWYSERLAERLRETLLRSSDPEAALAEAIDVVARDHALQAGASPSSTVALARWSPDVVDVLVLADSPVVKFGTDDVEVVADERLPRLRTAGRLRTRAAVDALRNHDGGFWVAEADPSAAAHAVQAQWPRAEVETLILATDGVAAGVTDYGLFDWHGLHRLAYTQGPQAVLDTVRDAERSDRDRTRWPRPKIHDDQALAVVDFTARSG
ncbi:MULTISPECIES: PP2C family serine/threonine-protein phosphatase [Prauserella salsuginis group]|uniref:PP2C family serine/threonine-protein phosphatase n=1 Tax=Prauserella salsuginis TaxID=387889 RepID=A0ABW6FZR8_9PSEU|nr:MULTISPECIES: PP2C family serine/threonine-protein phosphatase [Prauserella salsuginis group]